MKQNVYLYAPNFESGHGNVTSVWLPYTVGCIWSYAMTDQRLRDNFNLCGLGFLRDPVDQVVDSLDNPAVCGFSTYIWNENYNLALSKAIKQRYPNCLILFGGPNVPNEEEVLRQWRKDHAWIDVSIRYEGEIAFKNVLHDILDNKVKRDYVAHRVEDLEVPSPYLTGLFDDIVKDKQFMYSMTIETNRGCPFPCTFCDWGSLTYAKIKKFPLEKVFAEIEWSGRNQIEFISLADANFGVFPERDQAIAECFIETKKKYGYPQQISCTWYKNSNEVILNIAEDLTRHGLNRGLTLSVQSMHEPTLTAIKRKNMKINDQSLLFQECNRRHIPFYTELILGMPEETLASWRQGHLDLIEMGQHGCVYMAPIELLRNAEMTKQIDQYKIKSTVISDYWTCARSGISECQHIATETNTMSTDDMIDATIFSWMIISFHHHGWTELYSRYLHKRGWSYKQIYDNLETWLMSHPYYSQQIAKFRSTVSDFYHHSRSIEYYALWEGVKNMYVDRQQHLDNIAAWFQTLCQDDCCDEIIELQRHWIIDPYGTSKNTVELPSNLIYWILDLEPVVTKSPIQCEFSTSQTESWANLEEFLSFVVLRRKESFGKAIVNILPQQTPADFELNMECPMTLSNLSVS
jgi:putative methyltransferase